MANRKDARRPLVLNIRLRINHKVYKGEVTRELIRVWLLARGEGAPVPKGITIHAMDWKHGKELSPSDFHLEARKVGKLREFMAFLQAANTNINAVSLARDGDIQ